MVLYSVKIHKHSFKNNFTKKVKSRPCENSCMMAFTEAEFEAIQDLLELDLFTFGDADGKGTEVQDKPLLIKEYIKKVQNKLKNRPKVEFPSPCEWFNSSESWRNEHLQGRLSLLDFWTYCCINCMQILPDLEAVEEVFEYNNDVVVIGVHSAKFDNERVGPNISNAIQRCYLQIFFSC